MQRTPFFRFNDSSKPLNGLPVLVFAAALAACVSDPGARSTPRQQAADHAAIRALWSTLDDFWDQRDAQRFSRLFTADATFDFVERRQRLDGRDAVLLSFADRFPGFAPDLRHRTTVDEIRDIAPDVCAVTGSVEILRTSPQSTPVLLRFAIFAIMRRTGDDWRIEILRAYELPAA